MPRPRSAASAGRSRDRPRYARPWRSRLLALAVLGGVLALAVAFTGPGTGAERAVDGSGLVYLSGLDGHLLEARQSVPLHRDPAGPVATQVPVDTLAWVHAETAGWLEVSLAEGAPARGWVADYHLRGEVHLVDPAAPGCPVPASEEPGGAADHRLGPSTKVQLVDLAPAGAGSWVRVRAVATGEHWWVDRSVVSERPGPDVRRAPPGTRCEEIGFEPLPPHHRAPRPTGSGGG